MTTFALVRSTYNKGYFEFLKVASVRNDGWLLTENNVWFSPENVIFCQEIEPKKWDYNNIAPGTLCCYSEWRHVVGDIKMCDVQCVVLGLTRGNYLVLVDGKERYVSPRTLRPVEGSIIPAKIQKTKKTKSRAKD